MYKYIRNIYLFVKTNLLVCLTFLDNSNISSNTITRITLCFTLQKSGVWDVPNEIREKLQNRISYTFKLFIQYPMCIQQNVCLSKIVALQSNVLVKELCAFNFNHVDYLEELRLFNYLVFLQFLLSYSVCPIQLSSFNEISYPNIPHL